MTSFPNDEDMHLPKNDRRDNISLLEKVFLLTIFIIPIWPRYAMIYVPGWPDINLTRVAIFITIFVWLLSLIGFQGSGKALGDFYTKNKHVIHVVILLIIWRVIIILLYPQRKAVNILLDEAFSWFLLMSVGVTILSRPHRIWRALTIIVWSGLIVCLLGMLEIYLQRNLFANIVGTPTEDVERVILRQSYREGYRINATFSNPLSLAEYLVFIIPIALHLYKYSASKSVKIMSIVTVILSSINIWITRSRGAWAVLLIIGISYSLMYFSRKMRSKKRSIWLVGGVVMPIIFVTFLISAFIITELTAGRTPQEALSSQYRLKQLQMGVPLVVNEPIIGYGLGQASEVVHIFGSSVDNYYLVLALESGLPSLFLFLYLLFLSIRRGIKFYNSQENELGRLAGVLTVSIIGFATFLTVLSLKQAFPLLFLIIAIVLCLHKSIRLHV